MIESVKASPIQKLEADLLPDCGAEVWVKRDDLIHPDISGNKWRKLKYNIAALKSGDHVLTFGGAWSNHIRAVAAAGARYGFSTTGIIRGELVEPLNPVLEFAQMKGMQLVPASRQAYRQREDAGWVEKQRAKYNADVVWPEGGSNTLALRGVKELLSEIALQTDLHFDLICLPVGTGGTLAAVVAGLPDNAHALGVSVLKGGEFLQHQVRSLLSEAGQCDCGRWSIECGYHFGGYAKSTPELVHWIDKFTERSGIPLEPVYSGKLFYAVADMLSKGRLSSDCRILLIHTGGIY